MGIFACLEIPWLYQRGGTEPPPPPPELYFSSCSAVWTIFAASVTVPVALNDAMEIIDVLSPLLEGAPVAAPMALSAIDVLMDRYPAHFAASTGPDSESDSVVSMRCEPATLSIPRGGSIDVVMTLEMERPWHVNSNAPGGAYAVPMDIVVVGSGMTAIPKWPARRACNRVLSSAASVVTRVGGRPECTKVTKPVISAGLNTTTTSWTSGA